MIVRSRFLSPFQLDALVIPIDTFYIVLLRKYSALTTSLISYLLNASSKSLQCLKLRLLSLLQDVKGTVSVYSRQEVAKNSTSVPVVNSSHTKQ